MKIFNKSTKVQKGFTLVELSIVILVAGLMLTAVMKGQSMLESARAQKLLNDVKNVEALIGQYSNQKGRLPGDCNRDGIIGYELSTILNGAGTGGGWSQSLTDQQNRAANYDYSGTVLGGTSDVATIATDLFPCKEVAGDVLSEPNPNRWVNDLREANVISRNSNNRLFAKHVAEDFIFVGKFTYAPGSTASEEFNAIAVAGVPVSMAKRILMNINGSETQSSSGQMRVLSPAGAIESTAIFSARAQNEIVNLIFFYRNQPAANAI